MSTPHPIWFDAHCHLADPRLETTLDDCIKRSMSQGISGWVQGGISPEDWTRQTSLREKYGKNFLISFGLHPWWVAQASPLALSSALRELEQKLPVAHGLGELGLDFGDKFIQSKESQESAFRAQLLIAKQTPKPLILHIVRAHSTAIPILEAHTPYPKGGLVHSFSGDLDNARAYMEMGFLISISGAVTRDGHKSLKKAIPLLPSNRFVIETDTPDQVPQITGVAQGSLNEPSNLISIAKSVGLLRGVEYTEVLNQSTQNVRRVFEL